MVTLPRWVRGCEHVLYHWAYDESLISCVECGHTWKRPDPDGYWLPPGGAVPDDPAGESDLMQRDGARETDAGHQSDAAPDLE
jgi:hypothetical protein